MARRSKKSMQEILGSHNFVSFNHKEAELDRKIALTTEGFTTNKYCELVLRDRARLSEENALTICNYIIDYKREINAKPSTIKSTIQFLSELSRTVGIEKKFTDMSRDDILCCYLDKCRRSENDDPMHKWIGSYNIKREIVLRFFKWLAFPEFGDSKKRDKLYAASKEPKCIQDIPLLRRKEVRISKYKEIIPLTESIAALGIGINELLALEIAGNVYTICSSITRESCFCCYSSINNNVLMTAEL